jgi:antitoxin (DNA-binding transcriptional repressor) of toxin-antitoxin stability system
VTITRHGSPVVILQPADNEKQIDVTAVIQKMRRLRKAHRLNGLAIRVMIEQGCK